MDDKPVLAIIGSDAERIDEFIRDRSESLGGMRAAEEKVLDVCDVHRRIHPRRQRSRRLRFAQDKQV